MGSSRNVRRRHAAVLAVTALLVSGCGPGDTTAEEMVEQAGAGASTGATDIPHHEDEGLTLSGQLPEGDDHPPDLTTQQMHAFGDTSVFAIQGRRPDDYLGMGTGFVVDKDAGMAVTNAHVVQGLAAISGRFNTGQKASLHVIAVDPCTDLAVVHFSSPLPEQSQPLIIGSSDAVTPGDTVTALGYSTAPSDDPSGQKLLIASGLVNATKVPARPQGAPEYKDTIQHGATINPGSSGGPLLDHHGRVVGINTSTQFSGRNAAEEGQYYSISIDAARPEIVDKLLKGQSQNDMGWAVEEYYPGYFEALDPAGGPELDARMARGGIEGGLYVKAVTPGSGASKAGIRPGMLITKIQNTPTATVSEMCAIVESILPGTVAAVEGRYLLSDPERFNTQFYMEFELPGPH
ncbi:S1C family serine protease [Kocuria nitroreducens]|uniref:S1C family serine protease n=1 Tax=Kocuria nitroreducens TaxID=3058914 RepID=UPI0036D88A5A